MTAAAATTTGKSSQCNLIPRLETEVGKVIRDLAEDEDEEQDNVQETTKQDAAGGMRRLGRQHEHQHGHEHHCGMKK